MRRIDHTGFRSAIEGLIPNVWRVLRRNGVTSGEIDDALQQVLLQVHRRWSRLKAFPRSELKSYVCCAAVGVARDVARRAARSPVEANPISAEHPDSTPGPHAALERAEAIVELDRILSSMPDRQRIVFILYELEELSGRDIAMHLGLPLGTVASRLRKARERFRRALQEPQCAPGPTSQRNRAEVNDGEE